MLEIFNSETGFASFLLLLCFCLCFAFVKSRIAEGRWSEWSGWRALIVSTIFLQDRTFKCYVHRSIYIYRSCAKDILKNSFLFELRSKIKWINHLTVKHSSVGEQLKFQALGLVKGQCSGIPSGKGNLGPGHAESPFVRRPRLGHKISPSIHLVSFELPLNRYG